MRSTHEVEKEGRVKGAENNGNEGRGGGESSNWRERAGKRIMKGGCRRREGEGQDRHLT